MDPLSCISPYMAGAPRAYLEIVCSLDPAIICSILLTPPG
jgi:hypothetical protein